MMAKKTVTVSLSDGSTVVFGSDMSSAKEIRDTITNQTTVYWYYYKNAQGEGYFKKDAVINIHIAN